MEIKVISNIMKANDQIADQNRRRFARHAIRAVNMLSSPGAGKTSLLEQTFSRMKDEIRFGVIEGDVQTSRDAERIGIFGVPVVQINTGGGCHLDANMVQIALTSMDLEEIEMLFIENVGNLVCPASFFLGEHRTVVLLSTAEGDDKPMKYPAAFRSAHLMIVNKMDMLALTDFKVEAARRYALEINPDLEILEISCRTGAGLDAWFEWLRSLRS